MAEFREKRMASKIARRRRNWRPCGEAYVSLLPAGGMPVYALSRIPLPDTEHDPHGNASTDSVCARGVLETGGRIRVHWWSGNGLTVFVSEDGVTVMAGGCSDDEEAANLLWEQEQRGTLWSHWLGQK